jgi:hypothetical protein
MSLSAITQPNTYMGAYSAVPLKLYSTDFFQLEQYKYIANVVWNTVTISNVSTTNVGNSVFTLLTCTTPQNYNLGDTVLLDDLTNSGNNTGYYIVQQILSPTQFAIDLLDFPFVNTGFTTSNVIKWVITPDLDGYGKVDFSNTLKDFVTQNLTGQSVNYALSYHGPNTQFEYKIYAGSQKQYQFNFNNHLNSGGTVSFYATGLTSVSATTFQVGDVISINQQVVQWPYTDNYFGSGSLVGFTGTTNHSFLTGQQVNVAGQLTFPFYNGLTTIQSVGAKSILTQKSWQGNSPVEGGYIYGVPRPSYNTVTTITSITVSPTYGLVIGTSIPFTVSATTAIPGTIQFADGQITETPIELRLGTKYVYNAHVDRNDYSLSFYDKYVIQSRPISGNNISTIFTQSNCYRIEESTIGFLLSHTPPSGLTFNTGMAYEFFNSAGSNLGTVYIPKSSLAQTDWYSPIGLQQIGGSPYTNFSGTFASYSGSVSTYNAYVYLAGGTLQQLSNKICFQMNKDCSMYEVYHLMWKDKYGSFVSYPFIYMSRDNVSVERKTYYKQEGSWDYNTFQYYDYSDGEKNFYSMSRKSYILNSGWLYQFETALMEDLMQSASVYIQTPDNRLFQCHLTEDSLELFKDINEQLFSYTFNVRISNNEYRF